MYRPFAGFPCVWLLFYGNRARAWKYAPVIEHLGNVYDAARALRHTQNEVMVLGSGESFVKATNVAYHRRAEH